MSIKNRNKTQPEHSSEIINDGGITVVSKRIAGRFRNLKWLGMSVWGLFFFTPYLRWNDRQAILFDIPNRQFNLFDITLYPHDVWVLALILLFFAILLALVTNIAGRVFCGYFCFQTVWTDIYTLIETTIEGDTAHKAARFKQSPWNISKTFKVGVKHSLWLAIALFTGLSFVAWFTDVYELWHDYINFQAAMPAWIILATFTLFTYVFSGFMREQVCFWLCPYARLQSVMYDKNTVLPVYDTKRGEPRSSLTKGNTGESAGSCIDCNICVAVCPTGIDIRDGQQEGCITCGLCIDACDSVMDKINQPRGLVRYASHNEIEEEKLTVSVYKRFRFIAYCLIIVASLYGIVSGLTGLSTSEFIVEHERQPVFTLLSDGTIQNKYTLKLLNKTRTAMQLSFLLKERDDLFLQTMQQRTVQAGEAIVVTAFVQSLTDTMQDSLTPITFMAQIGSTVDDVVSYESVFISPK